MERSRLASGCLEPGKRVPGEPLNRPELAPMDARWRHESERRVTSPANRALQVVCEECLAFGLHQFPERTVAIRSRNPVGKIQGFPLAVGRADLGNEQVDR